MLSNITDLSKASLFVDSNEPYMDLSRLKGSGMQLSEISSKKKDLWL